MRKCLIVVDYQNDFVSGSLGFPEASELEKPITEKIEQYRNSGDEVMFTLDTHGEDYLSTNEGINLPVPHCVKNSKGHELYGSVRDAIRQDDKCFHKGTFGSDELFDYLRVNRYSSIELVGVVSNICVLANAVLAKTAQPQTDISVDALCVASNDSGMNTKAIDIMQGLHIRVVNRKD